MFIINDIDRFLYFNFQIMAAKKEYGLQNDGSLVVDEENDFCVQYLRNINWNAKPIERTTAAFPWITKDEFKNSMTHKYLHYQTEDGYCNPNDPLGMISHKNPLITIFGHKHEIKNFIKKFDIFYEKKFNSL